MLAVTTVLPEAPTDNPPIVLVHGAANSAVVWTYWQERFAARGLASHAVDLRGHGRSEAIDLSFTSMSDYADDVREAISRLDRKPIVIGWSMGGLVAMMLAACDSAVAAPGDAAEHSSVACVALRAEHACAYA